MVLSGSSVIGSVIMPDSERLTRSTSAACVRGSRFLWITPRPPSRATAMAMSASVTVSMAADRNGICSRIVRVRFVPVSTSLGVISL